MKRIRVFVGGLRKHMARGCRWAVVCCLLWYAFGVYQRHSAWCWDEPWKSPDGQYSLNLCNIRGAGVDEIYVARIYDHERRELVFERVVRGLDLSHGVSWGPHSVLWTTHEKGGADLPPTWLTRLRAKIP